MKLRKRLRNLELEDDMGEEGDINSDCDTCDLDEIKSVFSRPTSLVVDKTNLENKYILHIDGTQCSNCNVAVGTTDGDVNIYALHEGNIGRIETLSADNLSCKGIKFNNFDNNILYIAYNNGSIKLWDLRTPKQCVKEFKSDSEEGEITQKPISCFDISPNNFLLAAGTDLHNGDAYILFWDTRNTKMKGGYWESHEDDITQVKFHPEDSNKLLSASTDGLINVYDLSEEKEEDALTDVLNTESSVEQAQWWCKGLDVICGSTHTFDIKMWKVEDPEPYVTFDREFLGKAIKRKHEDYSYVAGTYTNKENDLIALIGSNYGDGKCLRSFNFNKKQLQPQNNFAENKQRIRTCWYNKITNVLVTGGEKGVLSVWNV